MTVTDLHWAAGFIEGEGSFDMSGTSPRVDAAQVNAQPLERIHSLFGGTLTKRRLSVQWQEQNYWYVYGPRAIGIMLTLYPLMSSRRQEQIRDVVRRWRVMPGRRGHDPARIFDNQPRVTAAGQG